MDILSFKWLTGDRITLAEHDKSSESWTVSFESGASLHIECMWRLIEDGDICSTSKDHGQQFGLAKPFDGVAALKEMGQYQIQSVKIVDGTGDLIIKFSELFVLQILVTSAGYECWSANHPTYGTVFTQGGQLHTHSNA